MKTEPITVLLVEDNPGDARLIQVYLSEVASFPVQLSCIDRLGDLGKKVTELQPDLLLLDLTLPDSDATDTVKTAHTQYPDLPIVVLTGLAGDEIGLAAVAQCAQDYLQKDQASPDTLRRSILYAIERNARQQAEESLNASQHDLRIAREIQFMLFPAGPPHLPGIDIAGASHSADEVDGDYYDYFTLADGSTGVCIGDACGHGLAASLLSARTHACLRTLAISFYEPGRLLSMANLVLASAMVVSRFVTLTMLRLDPNGRQLSFANAGHPDSYVIDPRGMVRAVLSSNGYPLGIEADTTYPTSDPIDLHDGDLVVLVTDGVIDVKNPAGERFCEQRVIECVHEHREAPAEQVVKRLVEAVYAHGGKQPVIRITPDSRA